MIEQALFTKRPGRPWDDRPTVQTAGLGEAQSHELATALSGLQGWLVPGNEAYEISFCTLSSGAFCVARTAPAAGGGFSLGTILAQCLVVDSETLGRFANNPFTLLQSVLAEGWLRPVDRDRPRLNRFTLEGTSAALDAKSLAQVIGEIGLDGLEALIEFAIAHPAFAIPAQAPRARLISALFNCLPVECRSAVSFTTGMAAPGQATFRWFGLEDTNGEHGQVSSASCFATLDMNGEPRSKASAPCGWSGLISRAIQDGRMDWLADQFGIARPGLELQSLDALGNELLQLLATFEFRDSQLPTGAELKSPEFADQRASRLCRSDVPHGASPSAFPQSAMAAVEAAPVRIDDDPSQILGQEHPEVLQQLELLDDVVFEAIAGKSTALDQLRTLWPTVIAELGPEALDESQSQYLRHAMSDWKDCIAGDEMRNPRLAVAAAEVVSILLGVT